MDARRMMDSGSSAFGSLERSSYSSATNSEAAAASSRSYSTGGPRANNNNNNNNMPQRGAGSRIQTRIPGVSVHSCVVRLRAEDQHLAEDIIEGLEFAKDRAVMSQLASHVNEIFLTSPKRSNPSPLGSRARGASPMVMLQC